MEYASMTFWLVVIVFTASGVHRLWSSMVQPKVVNTLLLPGTLVAQLGYVLGLLITGGTVNDTALIQDGESAEPKTGGTPQTRIPVIGSTLVALLPMIGCAIAIYASARYLGTGLLERMAMEAGDVPELPTSLGLLFALLHDVLDLVQDLVEAVASSDLTDWRTLLFLYLVVCMTVRMAPLTGHVRGSLGAIALTGLVALVVGHLAKAAGPPAAVWLLGGFALAVLLTLLMISLLVKGVVVLVKTVVQQG